MSNAVYGRGPNGRALRKDGSERKERRSLSASEKVLQIEEVTRKAYASIGRNLFASAKGLTAFASGIDIFRKWVKDARAYGSEDARNARRAYFQKQLDTIDAKGEAAAKWLPEAEKAEATIASLFRSIGGEIQSFVTGNKRQPDANEAEAIIRKYLTDDVLAIVEASNDPANDVFRGFRKDDIVEAEEVSPSDTL